MNCNQLRLKFKRLLRSYRDGLRLVRLEVGADVLTNHRPLWILLHGCSYPYPSTSKVIQYMHLCKVCYTKTEIFLLVTVEQTLNCMKLQIVSKDNSNNMNLNSQICYRPQACISKKQGWIVCKRCKPSCSCNKKKSFPAYLIRPHVASISKWFSYLEFVSNIKSFRISLRFLTLICKASNSSHRWDNFFCHLIRTCQRILYLLGQRLDRTNDMQHKTWKLLKYSKISRHITRFALQSTISQSSYCTTLSRTVHKCTTRGQPRAARH